MAHEDSGNYAGKRQGKELNETIAASIKERLRDHSLTCAEAHDIATKLNVDPAEVGIATDLLGIRINKCQLGLFQTDKGETVMVQDRVTPEVESAIRAALVNGKLRCLDAWNIAKTFAVSRKTVGNACESMKIKISLCQLGTFK